MTTVPHLLTHDLDRLREDSQFAATERDADAVEVEELVLKAIQLYSRLDRQHERWANPIREGSRPFSMEEGKSWQAAFQQWADEARRIIARARECERRGIRVDQLEALCSTLMHCDYDGLDIEKLVRSSEALEAGRGIPGAVIRDEIRRRLRG
jgi:hypothetical protein